ncbi:MAG: TRAP transporter substrate-binding protein DctP [Terriglobales bacterium]
MTRPARLRRGALAVAAALAFALAFTRAGAAQQITVKMGTLAPAGSPWHQILLDMGDQWRAATNGGVQLRIYPGGVLGDDTDLVLKMRIGQIQAAGLTSQGLGAIDPSVRALQIPMMLHSYEQLDYVRDHMRAQLEAALAAKGFIVLNWGDVGWVYFFTKSPVKTVGEIRAMKLFCWAGAADDCDLYRKAGFQPVALQATDMLTGLQTGLINAFDSPPLFALADQLFGEAKYMCDVKWAPLIGATVISKAAWDRIPPAQQAAMMQAAQAAGARLRAEIRKMDGQAVAAMQQRGLVVVHADAAEQAGWQQEAEKAYPLLRGSYVSPQLFDQAQQLANQFENVKGARGGH